MSFLSLEAEREQQILMQLEPNRVIALGERRRERRAIAGSQPVDACVETSCIPAEARAARRHLVEAGARAFVDLRQPVDDLVVVVGVRVVVRDLLAALAAELPVGRDLKDALVQSEELLIALGDDAVRPETLLRKELVEERTAGRREHESGRSTG